MKNQLLLVDGNSYIFRAFYAIRATLTNQEGQPTNAVFGFKNMLQQLVQQENSTHCVVVFDPKGPTFRNNIYPLYKANRTEAPQELKSQFSLIHEFVQCMNISLWIEEGFEADDVIGSLVQKFIHQIPIKIISGDKDLTQLVTDKVLMVDTMKSKIYDVPSVQEKFGVLPNQIIEYLALVGDASDNIPGAKGIGPKTATKLLQEYGNLETLYSKVDEIKGKLQEKIIASKDNVFLSKELATIKCDVSLDCSLDDFIYKQPLWNDLKSFYQRMNFKEDSFLKKSSLSSTTSETKSVLNRSTYQLITTEELFKELILKLKKNQYITLDLETTSLKIQTAQIVGIAILADGILPSYIPIAHETKENQLSLKLVLKELSPLFSDPKRHIVGQNIKYDFSVLKNHGCTLLGILEDTMILSYLLNSDQHAHNLNELAKIYLNHSMISYDELTKKGKKQISFAEVPLKKALEYAAEDVDATWRLYQILSPKLEQKKLTSLYSDIEMPLCKVLSKMESQGVLVDKAYFNELSTSLSEEVIVLETNIYKEAREEFNINSTKQLSYILFEKLGIQHLKKTKTGYSTDSSVLEKLSSSEPIAYYLSEYRKKTKLINTYLDVLPELIHSKTGRIHTSYNQSVVATGRLSSTNPNLQNIPIQGEDGNKIRAGFIAPVGYQILSADYSQVELRVLAHLSEDEGLIHAFKQDHDIHSETASAIYNISQSDISSDQRRVAKAINFGIIYGMGAYRLSQEIGISNAQAKEFIETYFTKYPKIKSYIEDTIAFTKKHGFVTTLFNRQRPIPGIYASEHRTRTAAERVATNTRIQGTAADIIKLAMIHIQNELDRMNANSKLLMQVHDELVFEVHNDEIEEIQKMIVYKMKHATNLLVPLKVDFGIGANWREAHA